MTGECTQWLEAPTGQTLDLSWPFPFHNYNPYFSSFDHILDLRWKYRDLERLLRSGIKANPETNVTLQLYGTGT